MPKKKPKDEHCVGIGISLLPADIVWLRGLDENPSLACRKAFALARERMVERSQDSMAYQIMAGHVTV